MYLIFDNEIAGVANTSEGLPSGFKAVDGPDAPLENLYWDGKKIALKPQKTNAAAYWDARTKAWKTPPEASFSLPPAGADSPNWNMLITSLQNTPEWGRAYTAAEKTLKANASFTTLMSALTMEDEATLQFALTKLREAMEGITGLGDFTPAEVQSINQKLKAAGFGFQI